MKKLLFIAMVLMLSACYTVPTHMKHLRPVPVIVYNYPCPMVRSDLYINEMGYFRLGWYYDSCRDMWFPRQYLNRGYIYRGESHFVQPVRPHQPPPVREQRPMRPQEPQRPPERPMRPQEPQRRPEVIRPPVQQREPQKPSQERRRPID
jgi:hypothetical protein